MFFLSLGLAPSNQTSSPYEVHVQEEIEIHCCFMAMAEPYFINWYKEKRELGIPEDDFVEKNYHTSKNGESKHVYLQAWQH